MQPQQHDHQAPAASAPAADRPSAPRTGAARTGAARTGASDSAPSSPDTSRPPRLSRRGALLAAGGAVGAGALASSSSPAAASTGAVSAAGAAPRSGPGADGDSGAMPRGVRPTLLHVVQTDGLAPEVRLAIGTLQGLAARGRRGAPSGPGIYLDFPTGGYRTWLDDMRRDENVRTIPAGDLWQLVRPFRKHVAGYVLYKRDTPSTSVAVSLAGPLRAIAVEESLEPAAEKAGLRRLLDVRGRTDAWVREQHWHRFRHDLLVEQRPSFTDQLRDYAVMAGAMTFFDGNTPFREGLLADLEPDSTVLGWGDASGGEDTFVGPASEAGHHTLASDWTSNLSVLSGIRADRITQRARPEVPKRADGTHAVSFLFTDGDNIQWLLGGFSKDPKWWASEHLGRFPTGWGMAPSLLELAPTAVRSLYRGEPTGAGATRFTVGPSGGGYLYPTRYPADRLRLHTARLAERMRRMDLGVVQIIDFEGFERTDVWESYLRHDVVKGLIYLEYSRYDGLDGRIGWAAGKPVIAAGGLLWDGLDGADNASLAAQLNAAPRDPSAPGGYTVVPVHCWSKSMDDVADVVSRLDPEVRVVTPDALVGMVRRDVRR